MDATVEQNIVSACKSIQGFELVKGLLSSLEDDPWYVDYCQVGVEEACSVGNAKVVQYLLSKLNESVKMNIISACKCDQALELVSALLSSLEDDSGYVNYCKIAMNEACRTGKIELVEYLLHSVSCSSSLINSTNEIGETPLHVASKLLNVGVCKVILQTGACNVNVQTVSGQTPLHLVVEATGKLDTKAEIAHLLLAAPDCNPDVRDCDGCTALMAACKIKTTHLVIIRALISSGKCDPNVQNCCGNTALHIATLQDYQEAVDVLVHCGGYKADLPNEMGKAPLHIACSQLNPKTASVLLKEGKCDVNAQTVTTGQTPLHLALTAKVNKHESKLKESVVRLLLEVPDCDPHVADAQGLTPLQIAQKTDIDIKTVVPLLEKGCEEGYSKTKQMIAQAVVLMNDELLDRLASKKGCRVLQCILESSSFNPDQINRNLQSSSREVLLIRAVQSENTEAVGLLLDFQCCDPNVRSVQGDTPLIIACQLANMHIIATLLHHEKCDLSAQNHDGNTALHYVVKTGCQEAIKNILYHERCVPDIANKQNETPLHIACTWLQLQAIEVFLHDGRCNVNLQTSAGHTPLHLVVGADDSKMKLKIEILALLLAIPDCNPNLRNHDGDTPLIVACKGVVRTKEYLPIIKAFLSSDKCDPNIPDNDGDTALHFATAVGCHDVVKPFLCSKRCQPNRAGKQGVTPLHVACFKVQVEAVQTLLEQGTSNVNLQANNGYTPLHMVILANDKKVESRVMIIDLLLAISDCDPNIKNSDGDTPLILACKLVDHEAMNFLLIRALTSSGKCDPNIQDKDGNTALHIVTIAKSQEGIKELICCESFQPDLPNNFGETSLHIACSQLNIQTVAVLLKEGKCDVNAQARSTGWTPLHMVLSAQMAKQKEDRMKRIAGLLLEVPQCDPHIADAQGVTPLQIAHKMDIKEVFIHIVEKGCADGSTTNKVIEQAMLLTDNSLLHLVSRYRSSAVIRNTLKSQNSPATVNRVEASSGDTPLIAAIQAEGVEAVQLLLESPYCDPNMRTAAEGDTPLIVACKMAAIHDTEGYLQIIHALLSNGKCDINSQNDVGNTALHIAAAGIRQETVIALVGHEKYKPDITNNQGRTPLHCACGELNVPTVTAILRNRNCDVNKQANSGLTPLHLIIGAVEVKPGSKLELIHLLLSHSDCKTCHKTSVNTQHCNQQCDPNIQNSRGDTPLHIAVRSSACDIVEALLSGERSDPNLRNNSGKTSLHIACELSRCDCVIALTRSKQCDINIPDNNGHAALHKAIYHMLPGQLSIIEHLISDNRCDFTACDLQGNTALHIACTKSAWKQDESVTTLIRVLLSTGKVDPQCVNNAGETPVQRAASNNKVYQLLSHFSETQLKHPIQTYVKVFVVGNAETGKSTLIEAICTEASKGRKYVPVQFKTVKGVKLHTAGIVPIPVQSRHFGNAIIYDFAGQHEYYSSHAAVLENLVLSSPPVFVVLVDLSKPFEQMSEVVAYWWSFIGSYTARSHLDTPPHVTVVGSHKDIVKSRKQKVSAVVSKLLGTLDGLPTNFVNAGFAALNCKLVASDGLTTLLSLLKKTCETLRKEVQVDLRCHVLYAFLQDQFPNSVACTLADILHCIKAEENTVLPQSTSDLVNLLATLSDKDRILLLKNSEDLERSWIILQRQKLYGEVNGSIFAPEYFDEHLTDFARSTGVVPLSKIKKHFPDHHPEIITGFLSHLEFCFKIGDAQTLELIADEEEYSTEEEFYFFPALVLVKNPPKEKVWKNEPQSPVNTQHNLKYGWFYECSHPYQYLMTRFLHVLLFRLAFSFALAMDHKPSHNFPAIRRKCSVWKRGISWLNNHGIETVLEVGLQNQWVVLLMQCSAGMEVECAKLQSAVVKIILDTKEEFCPSIGMHESLLNPCNC